MSDVLSRLNSALEGRYHVERELGQGGMATVYLADDLKHERKVALKVLKPELAAVVGAERFLTEIKTTANLQHPNILPLHDSGEADSFLFYVMPYVEGESLRERIERERQLPVDEAVRIAREVAEALQTAHEQGVIHRDIKPANILLSRGRPLVADFGIALAVSAAGGGRLTETGLSMGTPFYMSPEQASADRVPDARSDVYSLGCVLYEMLTGEPPYTGASAQAVLAKILTEDATRPTTARASIPPNVDGAIRKALQKLPADRFASIQELADALADPGYRYGADAIARGGVDPVWKKAAIGLAAASLVLVMGLGWVAAGVLNPEPDPVSRFTLAFDDGEGFAPGAAWIEFDIASDGRSFVYVGAGETGGTQIWRRDLDNLEPQRLPGTQDGLAPVFSPDGNSVLYWARGGLSVASLTGGPPFRLVEEAALGGGFWSEDGWVYYMQGNGISRVLATGGEPEVVVEPPETGTYVWLDPLPGGKTLIATHADGPPSASRIVAISIETGEVTYLVSGVTGRYASSGHLVYVAADGTLLAAAFDPDEAEVLGASTALLQGIQVKGGSAAMFSVADDGTLIYRSGSSQTGLYNLVWIERDGSVERVDPNWTFDGSSPTSGGADEIGVEVSPDGTRAAVKIHSEAGEDIYVKQLDRGPLSRLTFDEAPDRRPRWSPDGEWVLFNSDRGENRDLWRRRANGTGSPELVLDLERPILEVQISPDEEWFVLRLGGVANVTGGRDLVGVRQGDTTIVPLAAEPYDEKAAALSPDGRWLAYESTETGIEEIYVRPFPNVDDGKWQVSGSGGIAPRWSRSGDELYYVSGDREMTAAQISTDAAGSLSVDARIPLFNVDELALNILANWATYDVAPDGRFLAHQFDIDVETTSRLVLVDNWFQELHTRVPR
ncbi:MAG: protein kinase [Longimicrobiales bacterium]|nr:protein kinase [Longimicrobiales bacterium]